MNVGEAIREIAKPADEMYSVVGVVTAVNRDAQTCDVRPSNGMADLFDVRIQAAPMGDEGLTYTPKIGSVVIVTFINKHTGYVAVATELKNWYLVCNDVRLGDDTGEKAVKGQGLNARLSEMIGQQRNTVQALIQYATAQQAVTLAGPLAPLGSAYGVLVASLTPMLAQLAAIENLLSQHLSDKVRIG